MADPIYRDVMEKFAKRGGRYPGMDIPEFYAMATELLTPDEAAVVVAMPRGFATARQLAEILDRQEEEVARLLQGMATKGLCTAAGAGEAEVYGLPPLVPGIFEFQFMRGTRTERDRRLALLIHEYKERVDEIQGVPEASFPGTRVIPVDQKVEERSTVQTYDQMSAYVEASDPISVSTCYCRHEAELVDPNDTCGMPNGVCMQFGMGARFIIDKGLGREITRAEAMQILQEAEEAGLVHCSTNQQDITFVCNCCADHCVILKSALAQPKPALALNSGFQPVVDPAECNVCEECIERCPATALTLSEEDVPLCDLDRCFGCGVCATTCPTEAMTLVAKADHPQPPLDGRALREALRAGSVRV